MKNKIITWYANRRYKTNLKVLGNKVYSYDTHVATIEDNYLYELCYWSVTTKKHINYVARELSLEIRDVAERIITQPKEISKGLSESDTFINY
jgi:hypothetical protein